MVFIFALVNDAFAGDGEIFDKLAIKAGIVGSGLRRSGFIIAGLGLVMFTFLAIFNKIQWKHLAYIMFSTALLSGMIAMMNFFREGGNTDEAGGSLSFKTQGYTSDGGSNSKGVSASKTGG